MAEHHEGEKNQQWWKGVFPWPDGAIIRLQPEHEKGEGCDETSSGRYREAAEILVGFIRVCCGDAIETGQTQRAAEQEEKSDEPTSALEITQHDLVNQQRRRDAEGNRVGEGVKLAAEWALMPAQSGEASIKQVEDTGAQNECDGLVVERSGRVSV